MSVRGGFIYSFRGAVCMTHKGHRFLIMSEGTEIYFGASGNILLGTIKVVPLKRSCIKR